MTKRRVLVTGCTGYIGRHLSQRLLDDSDTELYGFNRKNDGRIPPGRFLSGDLLEADLLRWLEQVRPEVIFHTVAAHPKSPFENQLRVNAEGTRRLLQAVVDAGLRPRVVVMGSAAEYGLRDEPVDEEVLCRPESEYGISKLAQTRIAQLYAQRHNLPVVIGRVFNVYGFTERHLVIAALAHQIARAEARFPQPSEVHIQNLRSWRDFVHIDDVVRALLALSDKLETHNETSGQVYNIASGESAAISTVLDILLDETRLTPEQLHQVALQTQGIQKEDISWASIEKIRQHTGWEPEISLRQGLKRELDFWRRAISAPAATR